MHNPVGLMLPYVSLASRLCHTINQFDWYIVCGTICWKKWGTSKETSVLTAWPPWLCDYYWCYFLAWCKDFQARLTSFLTDLQGCYVCVLPILATQTLVLRSNWPSANTTQTALGLVSDLLVCKLYEEFARGGKVWRTCVVTWIWTLNRYLNTCPFDVFNATECHNWDQVSLSNIHFNSTFVNND